jgi:hypothetical protein
MSTNHWNVNIQTVKQFVSDWPTADATELKVTIPYDRDTVMIVWCCIKMGEKVAGIKHLRNWSETQGRKLHLFH